MPTEHHYPVTLNIEALCISVQQAIGTTKIIHFDTDMQNLFVSFVATVCSIRLGCTVVQFV